MILAACTCGLGWPAAGPPCLLQQEEGGLVAGLDVMAIYDTHTDDDLLPPLHAQGPL
eukprot:SAG25_NODE_2063_length_1992_cov_1.296883_2_plen_57_part_00